MSGGWRADIGLEVHVQLRTRTKMFCACPTGFAGTPNSRCCPVCLGYPGALPVPNREAIRLTVKAGLMLGGEIARTSRFDRKNYFYPDMPKNYQISQYDAPLVAGGAVEIATVAGPKTVRLTRIHLEEDVAKSMHLEGASLVDFNRAGTPLMEIVTEPDLADEDEAMAFLVALKEALIYAQVTEGNLEEGQLRCDINCSVRRTGETGLGVKTEIKNMNTFKGVHRALASEIRRQIREMEGGGRIVQETRRWDEARGRTASMRTKEHAHDYRYFPEPDLMPVELAEADLAAWRGELPEPPAARRARFEADYGLPAYDAGVLTADRAVADFFEAAAAAAGDAKLASNWVMTEVLRVVSESGRGLGELALTPASLGALIRLVREGVVNQTTAKELFEELWQEGGDPRAMVEARGLAQVRDEGALAALVEAVVAEHPGPVADYRGGKAAALQFLIGQVMRKSRGKAAPRDVRAQFEARLGGPGSDSA